MLLKNYVKSLVQLLNDSPEYSELEVWTYSDEEGNSILPICGFVSTAFVEEDIFRDTDEYITSGYLPEYLEDLEISLEDFLETNKKVILL